MEASIKIRGRRLEDCTEIKLLISHPMENGRNRDPVSGSLIPPHFIRELEVHLNDKPILTANLGGSMSMNPFFSLRLKNHPVGGRLTVRWLDNLDNSDSAEFLLE